jgi:hypothetical protein
MAAWVPVREVVEHSASASTGGVNSRVNFEPSGQAGIVSQGRKVYNASWTPTMVTSASRTVRPANAGLTASHSGPDNRSL